MTLAELRAAALALGGAVEAPHFDYASFRVGGRIFATVPPTGDRVHLFVAPERADGVAGCEPLWWGKKVVGVRADLHVAPAAELVRLLRESWVEKAPKRLVRAAGG